MKNMMSSCNAFSTPHSPYTMCLKNTDTVLDNFADNEVAGIFEITNSNPLLGSLLDQHLTTKTLPPLLRSMDL
ncbi:hypothetical protein VNO78_07859 [Psophocarpus tetragonolobus]|uniref:Uncharacterized protein n=1 Tax=Psophocarpus tetragonolobus TaxID=3891 RepID=A0AAN9XSG1_PSOTE